MHVFVDTAPRRPCLQQRSPQRRRADLRSTYHPPADPQSSPRCHGRILILCARSGSHGHKSSVRSQNERVKRRAACPCLRCFIRASGSATLHLELRGDDAEPRRQPPHASHRCQPAAATVCDPSAGLLLSSLSRARLASSAFSRLLRAARRARPIEPPPQSWPTW